MKPWADNALRMPASGIRQLMELARALPDVVHLEAGDPDFPTPEHVLEAAARAARAGFTHYTATAGLSSLREALAAKLQHQNDLRVTPDQVVVTHGSVNGLAAALLALVNAGEEVLIPDPGWPNYEAMVRAVGARPVRYHLPRALGFQPDLEGLRGLLTPRTKAIILNTPSNPTGAVFPAETVRQVVEVAHRHDLYLLSDEAYEDIVFEGEHQSPARFDEDGRVVSVFTFSKSYAMTGWRVGYLVAARGLAAHVAKVQESMIECVSAVSQKAAEAALLGPREPVTAMVESYRCRRDLAWELLTAAGRTVQRPAGTFYMLVDASGCGEDTYALARGLVQGARVAVAPGETFGAGGRGLLRISLVAGEDRLREGIRRLTAHLDGCSGAL